MLGSERCQSVDHILISEAIPRLMDTSGCGHSYLDVYQPPVKGDIHSQAYKWQSGLSFQANQRPLPESLTHEPINTVFVQNVDNNLVGQCIAYQWTSARPLNVIILQKDSCLCCIFIATTSYFDICIINGCLKNQPSKESKSYHGSQLPAKAGIFRVLRKPLPDGVNKVKRAEIPRPDRSKSRQTPHRAPMMVTEPSKNDSKLLTNLRPKGRSVSLGNLDLHSH